MELRAAEKKDFSEIMRVYRAAKAFMDATGNDTQWEVGYPSEEMVMEDIEHRDLYVITERDEIHAVFYFFNGEDEIYQKVINLAEIFDGAMELILYDSSKQAYVKTQIGVDASPYVLKQFSDLIGEENVVLR